MVAAKMVRLGLASACANAPTLVKRAKSSARLLMILYVVLKVCVLLIMMRKPLKNQPCASASAILVVQSAKLAKLASTEATVGASAHVCMGHVTKECMAMVTVHVNPDLQA